MPLMIPAPNILTIYFSQNDIDTSKDHNHISNIVAEAHILQDREVDQAWWANPVAIGIGRAVTDDIKSKLALRCFNPAVNFPCFGLEAPKFGFGIDDWAGWYLLQGLLKNLN